MNIVIIREKLLKVKLFNLLITVAKCDVLKNLTLINKNFASKGN